MEKIRGIKAVIFDLDGTLIDTEKYFRVAWPLAFEHFGYRMEDEQYLFIRSLGRPFIYDCLKNFSGDENFDYDSVQKFRSGLMEKMIQENGLQAKKGAVELLEFLKSKNVVRAIATASPVERAERYLKMTGLDGFFDKIISARDMKEGKPSPDVYLYAVKELGLKACECVAVEDSPNGALSAVRAGLKVVFVPDQSECDEETKKIVFTEKESLDQICQLWD